MIATAFARDGAPFAPGTSSTYGESEDSTASLAQGSGLVPPGAAGAVTLQQTSLPGPQLRATRREHPRDERSRELREGPEPVFTARQSAG